MNGLANCPKCVQRRSRWTSVVFHPETLLRHPDIWLLHPGTLLRHHAGTIATSKAPLALATTDFSQELDTRTAHGRRRRREMAPRCDYSLLLPPLSFVRTLLLPPLLFPNTIHPIFNPQLNRRATRINTCIITLVESIGNAKSSNAKALYCFTVMASKFNVLAIYFV